jgi:hypothetical protein
MKGKLIWSIFWTMVGVFVIALCLIFIPPIVGAQVRFSGFDACPVLAGLGVILIVLTVKRKVEGKLKKFLLLTGASTIGLPVFIILHNVVIGLFNTEEPVFFILATLVCPIGFLVGMVGTIWLNIKTKPSVPMGTSEGGKS